MRTRAPPSMRARSSVTKRVLPNPASPPSNTIEPCPSAASRTSSSTSSSSAARPTKRGGVTALLRVAELHGEGIRARDRLATRYFRRIAQAARRSECGFVEPRIAAGTVDGRASQRSAFRQVDAHAGLSGDALELGNGRVIDEGRAAEAGSAVGAAGDGRAVRFVVRELERQHGDGGRIRGRESEHIHERENG